jgi:hypothetical protein
MRGRRAGASPRWLSGVVAGLGVLAFGGAARFGLTWIPVGLAPFDDEGCLMISVQSALAGKPLYDEIYSQYGPFYYLLQGIVHGVFGLPVTHDVTRQILLIDWLAAAVLTAWIVHRLTRSGGWTILSFLAVAAYLFGISVSPGHPQEIILIAVSAVVLLASALRSDGTQRIVPLAIGALAAGVVFTKVNVGAFLVVGLGLALLRAAPRSAWTRWSFLLGATGAVILPFLVMRAHLPAAMTSALGSSLAIACCTLAAWWLPPENPLPARTLLRTAGSFAVTAAVVCGLTLYSGTSFGGLLDGILRWPLRFATALLFPGSYPPAAVVASASSLVLCAVVVRIYRTAAGRALRFTVAAMRFLYGTFVLWCVCLYRPDELLWYGVPFVWLVLPPADDEDTGPCTGRAALALVAVLQSLQAYPVRGAQLNCATYLAVAAGAVSLADGLRQALPAVSIRRAVEAALALLAVVGAHRGFLPAYRIGVAPPATPLALPGSDRVQVSAQDAAKLRWITSNLRAHCDTFVSKPGINSYYVWTGMDPPTGLNIGMWMVLLDERQQQRIVDALARAERPCVVRDQHLAAWWSSAVSIPRAVLDARPLSRYIEREFAPVSAVGGLELMLPKGRDATGFEDYLLWGDAELDGTRSIRVPPSLLAGAGDRTLTAWFRAAAPGVILGCQRSPALDVPATESLPILYVDREGRLAGQLAPHTGNVVASAGPVNDGAWHQAALVLGAGAQALYVDGELVGSLPGPPVPAAAGACQIGAGDATGWPSAEPGWTRFRGTVADISVTRRARSAEEIRSDHAEGRRSATRSRER